MASEYTPKPTARIRDLFVFATAWDMTGERPFHIRHAQENAGREWDAWLAAHDRAVKAEALREAAEHLRETASELSPAVPSELAYFNCTYMDAKELDLLADDLERGDHR